MFENSASNHKNDHNNNVRTESSYLLSDKAENKSKQLEEFRSIQRLCRKRWRIGLWSLCTLGLLCLTLHTLNNNVLFDTSSSPPLSSPFPSSSSSSSSSSSEAHYQARHLLQIDEKLTNQTSQLNSNGNKLAKLVQDNTIQEEPEKKNANFPPDFFTAKQRRNGAVIVHILGMIYMFVALAIVCDEFFIPALDVITEKLNISEDVAGATFMAAGGSAPELFTSIIGVFISFDDVGIGTIVGSAVFNILFVLSMCAIFSKAVLDLTWWPLFRDVSFYSLILITLVLCFKDSEIYWYEALILLIWYSAYVGFMKYNEQMEQLIRRGLFRTDRSNKVDLVEGDNTKAKEIENNDSGVGVKELPSIENGTGPPANYQMTRKMSTPILHGGSKFRQGVLQLMIHSIDPLYEEPVQYAMRNGNEIHKDHIHPPGAAYCPICGEEGHRVKLTTQGDNFFKTTKQLMSNGSSMDQNDAKLATGNGALQRQETMMDEEMPEPLDMAWPKDGRKQITYILLAPIIFPLWATLPDVRRPEKRHLFAFSFIGSIIWIAIYSYLMVWWATLVGETFNIPVEVMGLTFLAAGTSIPDLITSVLVARKGLGDMAVSSSIGSNIFDVAVGLPFPWLLYCIIFGAPVRVNSSGMVCSVVLLFIMLIFVIATIAVFNWRLNIGMAIVMFIFYFVFIAISLLLEKKIIDCNSIFGA